MLLYFKAFLIYVVIQLGIDEQDPESLTEIVLVQSGIDKQT